MFLSFELIGSLSGFASQIILSVCFDAVEYRNPDLSIHLKVAVWFLGTIVLLGHSFFLATYVSTRTKRIPSRDEGTRSAQEVVFGSYALVGIMSAWAIFLGGSPFENFLLAIRAQALLLFVVLIKARCRRGPPPCSDPSHSMVVVDEEMGLSQQQHDLALSS